MTTEAAAAGTAALAPTAAQVSTINSIVASLIRPGERYAGIVLCADGSLSHHLFLLPGEFKGKWNAAVSWAKEAGGELPTLAEQAVLFGNAQSAFNEDYYWSGEQHADADHAWYQDFSDVASTTATASSRPASALAQSANCQFNPLSISQESERYMNTATKSEQRAVSEAEQSVKSTLAAWLKQILKEGEHYAGVVIGKDGLPSHHLVLMAVSASDVSFAAAQLFAAKAGGTLPTRQEQALLFANLKAEFEPRAYWSGEQHAAYAACAWSQYFHLRLPGLQHQVGQPPRSRGPQIIYFVIHQFR